MDNHKLHDIPSRCPITGEDLIVSELRSSKTGVTIRGAFHVPRMARLDPEFLRFLEVFLRARGVITTVEKELGISYPTVRGRLDSLLEQLDLKPYKDDKKREASAAAKRRILQELEEGKITPSEAKDKLRSEAKA